jgi:hypothetical protein
MVDQGMPLTRIFCFHETHFGSETKVPPKTTTLKAIV